MESKIRVKTLASALLLVAVLILAGCAVSKTEEIQKEEKGHPVVAAGQQCTSCKDMPNYDYKPAEPFASKDCAVCHNAGSWTVKPYEHEANKDMNIGMHSMIDCMSCHNKDGELPPTTCEGCHAQKDGDIPESHKEAKSLSCAVCHTPEQPWILPKPVPTEHVSLEGGHEGLPCFNCHYEVRDPALPEQTCGDCHGPKHGGLKNCESCHHPSRGWKPSPDFDHSAFYALQGAHKTVPCAGCHRNGKFAGTSTDCVDCHGVKHRLTRCASCHRPTTGWKALPGFNHGAFGFALTGQHKKIKCDSCHPKRRYVGTPRQCVGCHKVAHVGLKNCESCHNTVRFAPASFGHSKYFNLTGKHRSLACTKCHKNGKYKGTPRVCGDSACHGAAHGGLTACTDCHTTSGWKPTTFEHENAWPLEGAHALLACSACHSGGNYKDPIGDPGKTCFGCHSAKNPHGSGSVVTNCTQCHTPVAWKPIKSITHPGSIRLGAKHTNLGCALCHGNALKFAEPTIPCQTCHLANVPHVGPTGCRSCHQPTTWNNDISFTHKTLTFHNEWINPGSWASCLTCHPGRNYTTYFKNGCGVCHP
ncbi:MAG: hypothetical protein FWE94_00185 [Coriobacteriia bacterium]|nr:hypothetical protein [Coriobacteriia bacterium]